VDAEYLSALWNADIESVRRAKSGAVASDIYNNKIVAERSYMQAASTRAVTFEMCGNDGLQARTAFKKPDRHLQLQRHGRRWPTARPMWPAMDYINANAYAGVKVKVISNLHYPGYNADNVQSTCKDATTGATINCATSSCPSWPHELLDVRIRASEGLPVRGQLCPVHGGRLRQQRRRAGRQRGAALPAGESEANYVTRITSTLKATLRDANAHFVSASSSYDYIQSDDTHPTYTGGTVTAGLFGGTTGSGAPRYTSFGGGQEPDLEPVRARTHGLGGIHLQPRVTLIATEDTGIWYCDARANPCRPRGPAERPAWGPNRGLLVVAALLAASGLAWFLLWPDSPPEATAVAHPPLPSTRSAAEDPGLAVWRIQKDVPTWQAPQATHPVVPDPERDNDPTRDLSSYVPRGAQPSMAEVITRLNEAGVSTGLGAFSPPGTRPPLIGLAVPEDYALPPGYVRHHQATDDGQRIEAILMFAPGSSCSTPSNNRWRCQRPRGPPGTRAPRLAHPAHRDSATRRRAELASWCPCPLSGALAGACWPVSP
jgi:hypothetical protein